MTSTTCNYNACKVALRDPEAMLVAAIKQGPAPALAKALDGPRRRKPGSTTAPPTELFDTVPSSEPALALCLPLIRGAWRLLQENDDELMRRMTALEGSGLDAMQNHCSALSIALAHLAEGAALLQRARTRLVQLAALDLARRVADAHAIPSDER